MSYFPNAETATAQSFMFTVTYAYFDYAWRWDRRCSSFENTPGPGGETCADAQVHSGFDKREYLSYVDAEYAAIAHRYEGVLDVLELLEAGESLTEGIDELVEKTGVRL
jgi:hypothetical protein